MKANIAVMCCMMVWSAQAYAQEDQFAPESSSGEQQQEQQAQPQAEQSVQPQAQAPVQPAPAPVCVISQQEAQAYAYNAGRLFVEYDKDKNGRVSYQEYMRAQWFQAMRDNRLIYPHEFTASVELYKTMDVDGQGVVLENFKPYPEQQCQVQ